MEIAFFVTLTILLVVAVFVFGDTAEGELRKQLKKDHLEPIEVKHDLSKSTTISAHVDFTARSKSGEVITGYACSKGGMWIMHYPPGFDRLKHLRQTEGE